MGQPEVERLEWTLIVHDDGSICDGRMCSADHWSVVVVARSRLEAVQAG